MPEMRKDSHSGAILFFLTPEEEKTENVIKENEAMKERLEKLEKLVLSAGVKAPENVPEMTEDLKEEPKSKKSRAKKLDATE